MSESQSVMSMWALIASWFTPTILFCVMNLMIGAIFITSNLKSNKKGQNQDGRDDDRAGPTRLFARAPSLVDRVKSINFSLYKPSHPLPDPNETARQPEPRDNRVTRTRSESAGESPAAMMMKKSASEKAMTASFEEFEEIERRRPATMRERREKESKTASSGGEDREGVDAKADDFINRFKQQLRMQRLDSLIRYKDMFGK